MPRFGFFIWCMESRRRMLEFWLRYAEMSSASMLDPRDCTEDCDT